MKLYKGTLHFYSATGETSHFYVWTGNPKAEYHDWENHVPVNENDLIFIKYPNIKDKAIVIFPFPYDFKSLEKLLTKKTMKDLIKASKENWEVEICKLVD